jgi:hypothetical protein
MLTPDDDILELAQKYYRESATFVVLNDMPEALPKGSAAPCAGALLSIDLEAPPETMLIVKDRAAYFRISHVCLSLFRDIVISLGARGEWMQLSGNGIVAYFIDHGFSNNVWNALLAARQARSMLAEILPEVAPLFKTLKLSVKSAIHYDLFLEAHTGLWGQSAAWPVGAPLHVIAAMQTINTGGAIFVSESAQEKLDVESIFGHALSLKREKYKKILFAPVSPLKTGGKKYPVYVFNDKNFEKLLTLSARG